MITNWGFRGGGFLILINNVHKMSPTSYKFPVGGYYNNYRQLIAEEGVAFLLFFLLFLCSHL